MSDRELIGQMVMIGFDGTKDMDADRIRLMKEYYIGNVFLFGWNTETFSQTGQLIEKIESYNTEDIPLMFGIDLEGGSTIIRFKNDLWDPPLWSAQKLGLADDPVRVYNEYYEIGTKLKSVGINIDFAPVLDIAHDPSSTYLSDRMFGSDPEEVSSLICRAIDGLHDAGIASLGKHFPGHGDTHADPHKELPIADYTPEQMDDYYLIPFHTAISKGVDAMMMAHVSYPNIDKQNVTTVSPTFVTDMLRGRMGFEGVVVSDDLRMTGFSSQYSVGEGAVLYVLAGGDMVLIGKFPEMQEEVCESLFAAVKDGRLNRARLEESVRRILELKYKFSGFQQEAIN
jgi:beta-N-acetylhexosaminidase